MHTKIARALSSDLLSQLSLRGNAKDFSRNELVVAEGDVSNKLFILISGQLKVFTRDARGRELVYNILDPGEVFGESLFDGGPRSASVKAIIDSQCIVIDQLQIRAFASLYPEFSEWLICSLISRLRHATQLTRSLALDDVHERTVALLNDIALNQGGTYIISSAITQQEIADRVGATREMVNHILGELTREGLLVRDENRQLVFVKKLPTRC